MIPALLMAGGRGERMRATGTPVAKPLVSIRGVPLLERNLLTLVYSGFTNIVVAVPSHTPEVGEFVRSRGAALAAAAGAHLELFDEACPLGNIGAVAELGLGDTELLVVYADNLTSLNLNALVSHHQETAAAMTCAVHLEPFRIPYGEVRVQDGAVVAYLEKPERRILISSGVSVLSPTAIASVPRGERTEVSWLVNRLLADGAKVGAFLHESPWVDVNDFAAIGRAEQLLADHRDAFDLPNARPA